MPLIGLIAPAARPSGARAGSAAARSAPGRRRARRRRARCSRGGARRCASRVDARARRPARGPGPSARARPCAAVAAAAIRRRSRVVASRRAVVPRGSRHRVQPALVLDDPAVRLVRADDHPLVAGRLGVRGGDDHVRVAAVERAREAVADPDRLVEDDRAVVLAVRQLLAAGERAPREHAAAGARGAAAAEPQTDDVRVEAVGSPGAARRRLVAVDRHLDLRGELQPVAALEARELAGAHREHRPWRGARGPGDRHGLAQLRMLAGGRRVRRARRGLDRRRRERGRQGGRGSEQGEVAGGAHRPRVLRVRPAFAPSRPLRA